MFGKSYTKVSWNGWLVTSESIRSYSSLSMTKGKQSGKLDRPTPPLEVFFSPQQKIILDADDHDRASFP